MSMCEIGKRNKKAIIFQLATAPLDTGLLCYLLRIKKMEDLRFHSQIGRVFETFVISELMKLFYHHDQEPPFIFDKNEQDKK